MIPVPELQRLDCDCPGLLCHRGGVYQFPDTTGQRQRQRVHGRTPPIGLPDNLRVQILLPSCAIRRLNRHPRPRLFLVRQRQLGSDRLQFNPGMQSG